MSRKTEDMRKWKYVTFILVIIPLFCSCVIKANQGYDIIDTGNWSELLETIKGLVTEFPAILIGITFLIFPVFSIRLLESFLPRRFSDSIDRYLLSRILLIRWFGLASLVTGILGLKYTITFLPNLFR
jgi:hypothetical protein